jgi:hypothetical protein
MPTEVLIIDLLARWFHGERDATGNIRKVN